LGTEPAPDPSGKAPAGNRRGFPFWPTLFVLLAVPTLIGFGVWQLTRLHWKEALLADLARNSTAPLAELEAGPIPDDAQFRRVRLLLDCAAGSTAMRAGRNLRGETGYSHLAECKAGAEAVQLDAGWSSRPEPIELAASREARTGRLVRAARGGWLLVADQPVPPLEASAAPGLETISNNHLSYAIQWFSFAAILSVIYALWLRRRLAQRAPAA
jgi:cytochrome oxidase assembly protein ShyY1